MSPPPPSAFGAAMKLCAASARPVAPTVGAGGGGQRPRANGRGAREARRRGDRGAGTDEEQDLRADKSTAILYKDRVPHSLSRPGLFTRF